MVELVIIDDEEMILKGLIYTMDWLSMGINVVGSTDNGRTGLTMIQRLRPDIVLTDIKMPLMDGLTMVEEARKAVDFKAIFLTSYQDFDYAKKAISLEAVDYLLKPVDELVLRELMDKLVVTIQETKEYQTYKRLSDKQIGNFDEWTLIRRSESNNNYYVDKTFDYIENCFAEKVSPNQLADSCQVSPSYLRRTLKKHTGKTFLELLHAYRIHKSIQLLKRGNLRVSEISEICGFNDYKHFYAVFKKHVGVSPTDFFNEEPSLK